jgi:hypothetical protein
MLRETILARNALGLPTLTTFKGEGNYVRLHDLDNFRL